MRKTDLQRFRKMLQEEKERVSQSLANHEKAIKHQDGQSGFVVEVVKLLRAGGLTQRQGRHQQSARYHDPKHSRHTNSLMATASFNKPAWQAVQFAGKF